jgi:FixJ family two-component response regulator
MLLTYPCPLFALWTMMRPWHARPNTSFRSFGFRAEAFLSAQEFLESSLVEETKCLILILDLRMPGMDGLELQRKLISTHKRIPIIFISARVTEEERMEALTAGAVDFLRKPFNEDALLKAIQAALNR